MSIDEIYRCSRPYVFSIRGSKDGAISCLAQENGPDPSSPPQKRSSASRLAGHRRLLQSRKRHTTAPTTTKDTLPSVFARKTFHMSNRVAVGPTCTTRVLSGAILAGKNGVHAGLEIHLETCWTMMVTQKVLEVHVAPMRNFASSRDLEEYAAVCASASSSSGGSCDPNETKSTLETTPQHSVEVCGRRKDVVYLVSNGMNPESCDSAGRRPRELAYGDFTAGPGRRQGQLAIPKVPTQTTGGYL